MTQREPGHLERIVEGIDHADDAIAMFELDGTFIYCNAAWKVLHRLDPEADYTGQKDSVIDMPELRPGIEELKSNIGPGFKYVTRQTLETDGTEKTFTISVNYISGREKPVVLVMFRDVTDLENARCDLKQCHDRLEEIIEVRTAELEETNMMLIEQIRERKEAEKSLREKEEHVRNLFKALPIATFTFLRQGDSFVFKDYNDAAVEMTRGHVTDDVGKRADVMLKDRPGILEDLEKCFSEKKSFEYEREYYDDVIGERWDLSVSYVFVPPDTVMVHTENITARVNAEKELKEHHDHLQELVGERTAELEEVNRLLREEIAQRENGKLDEFSIVHPEDRSRLMGILPRLKEQAPVESIEFRMISKSGRDVWVEAMAKPLPPSGEGYPRGMIAVKDINDRKTAEVELARRNRELAVVNRIREIFDSGSRDREIMDMILEALLDNSEALSAGVCNVDRDTGSLEIIAARNISGNFIDEFGKSPLLTETASRIIDDNMVLILQEDSGPTTKRTKVMRKYGVYQTIAFPVKTRGGETAIFMIGYGKDRKLGQEKMRFFDIVRNQVRLQFERRVLLADREWHERELRDLTVSLIGLLEKERNMIALKLHDELGQELVAVNAEILFLENQIESCENKPGDTLAKIKEQLKKLTRNVREMSYSIHPAVLEDLGLRPALHSYIERFIESGDLHVDLVTTGFDGKLIGSESLAMYRIAQEALTNVVKHAEARNVTVRIIRGYPDLILTIEDDGKGFTPDGEEFRGKGLGIINMRERVEGMGGRFRIYSAPGKGTRIRAAIPMEGQDDE
jgi:PAS domain S-box-containing protein